MLHAGTLEGIPKAETKLLAPMPTSTPMSPPVTDINIDFIPSENIAADAFVGTMYE